VTMRIVLIAGAVALASGAADLKEGYRVDVEYVAGGLAEFEAIAL
jgi:hypothetical protein